MSPPSISFHALTVHVVSFFHLLDCWGLNAVFDPLHIALSLVELVKYLKQKLPQGLGLQDDRPVQWQCSRMPMWAPFSSSKFGQESAEVAYLAQFANWTICSKDFQAPSKAADRALLKRLVDPQIEFRLFSRAFRCLLESESESRFFSTAYVLKSFRFWSKAKLRGAPSEKL